MTCDDSKPYPVGSGDDSCERYRKGYSVDPRDSKGYSIIIDDPDCVSTPFILHARVTSVETLNSRSPPMSEYELPRKRYSLYLIQVFRSTIAEYVQVDKKTFNKASANVIKYYTDKNSYGYNNDDEWDHADIDVTLSAGDTAYLVTEVGATDPNDGSMYCDFDLTVGKEYLLRPSRFFHSSCYGHDSRVAQITNSSNEVYMAGLGVCFPYYNYENPSVDFLHKLKTECDSGHGIHHLIHRQQARDDKLFANDDTASQQG